MGFGLGMNTMTRVSVLGKLSSELGLSDLEHGNETAVQTDSVGGETDTD